ncbi:hypothetical protein KIK06_17210 [Nocardiopsis sp. EMB25]|uniref:hypothetical protein n=1 Tax=Nocardiopsis sp. EMB25 TaxID=2835867 RepID=UPI002284EB38|nr:hypothetical protein [Nocardiopsis sp. EMB25]MCY9785626.1 hypothetical protein [Nocardiopsis sp. EMB25]
MRRTVTGPGALAVAVVLILATAAPAAAATGKLVFLTAGGGAVVHDDPVRCVDLPDGTWAVHNGTDAFVTLNSAPCAHSAQLGIGTTLPPSFGLRVDRIFTASVRIPGD